MRRAWPKGSAQWCGAGRQPWAWQKRDQQRVRTEVVGLEALTSYDSMERRAHPVRHDAYSGQPINAVGRVGKRAQRWRNGQTNGEVSEPADHDGAAQRTAKEGKHGPRRAHRQRWCSHAGDGAVYRVRLWQVHTVSITNQLQLFTFLRRRLACERPLFKRNF